MKQRIFRLLMVAGVGFAVTSCKDIAFRELLERLVLGEAEKIVFMRDENLDGSFDICIMNTDGSVQRTLTDTYSANEKDPKWYADGERIIFSSNEGGEYDVYSMDRGGADLSNVSKDGTIFDYQPVFAPDESKIAFTRYVDPRDVVYVMNPDGSNKQSLTSTDSRNGEPDWSPDSQKIAFISNRDNGASSLLFQIYTMDANGANEIRVKDSPDGADERNPAWSPDGGTILYCSDIDGDDEIYAIDVNTKDIEQLTYNTYRDIHPDWSPDGERIVFASNRDTATDRFQIYIMRSDGSGVERLTDNSYDDKMPDW